MSTPSSGAIPPRGSPVPTSLKAPATSSTNPESVTSSTVNKASSSPAVTPPSSAPRRSTRPISSDFLSDKATAAFIRRVLCAQHLADRGRSTPAPIQDLLPPLTSRNDVDLQLYALIAVIIKEFVQNWYARITPDETFVSEIVHIIAHCTRALEERLRNVDLESLLFDELPELLDAHIRAYRLAKSSVARPPVEANPREIYHSLWPLPALSPVPKSESGSAQVQASNESEYRQLLVQGVLALLLPTEDLENECLTALVGQILSELVIGNLIVNKLSEPWLIWEILIMLTRLVRTKGAVKASEPRDITPSINLKADAGIVPPTTSKTSLHIQESFWTVIQWGFTIVNSIRLMISTLMLSRSLPPRSTPSFVRLAKTPFDGDEESYHPPAASETPSQPVKIPIADFKIWSCAGNLLEIDARMPWMSGAFSMIQWGAIRGPGNLAGFDGMIDRLLSHHIHAYILDPARLPPLLRAVRGAIFPNNAPGVSSLIPPSSGEQLAALRRRCASALLALVPRGVGRLYYGSSTWLFSTRSTNTQRSPSSRSGPFKTRGNNTAHNTNSTGEEVARVRLTDEGKTVRESHATLTPEGSKRQFGDTGVPPTEAGGDNRADMCDEGDDEEENRILSEIETGILDVFSDPYCNKHLVYGILELILVRLMPELAEKGVIELWEERLS
ncbi:PXA domain-containing protein [Annulohypoxylon truncatum]|uniref:PXA domain-containing protein n=1 Tax=Annulohypoxylon truncatum TaxID=327061 RepID=UPI0020074D12|nr:PXA domain-containing protein [Annulohypoxylon truncatum]KAI1212974.1 PXA domain-containing protein [Annulohypoxylon truncatum]